MQTASELSLWQKHVSLWQEIVAISNESNHEIHFGCKCWMFGNHAVCGLGSFEQIKGISQTFCFAKIDGSYCNGDTAFTCSDGCLVEFSTDCQSRHARWILTYIENVRCLCHRLPPAYLAVKTSSGPNSFELRTNHRITILFLRKLPRNCTAGRCRDDLHDIPGSWGTFLALRLLDPAGFLWSKLAPPCLHLQLCAACTDWASQITSLVP